jgi:acetamidase/formamidase
MSGGTIAGVRYGWDSAGPALVQVAPGDELTLTLRDASDGQIDRTSDASAILAFDRTRGNPLTGPVVIEGAQAGDVLGIEILGIETAPWGWSGVVPGFGLLADDFREPELLAWSVSETAAEALGFRLEPAPFPGVLGICPAGAGPFSVVPPREVGGNLDLRDLVPGTTLWLPIAVDGAWFAAGDAHALQGDGEVCGTGLEIGARLTVRLTVRRGRSISAPAFDGPVAPRPAGTVHGECGVGPDPLQAARDAVRRIVDWAAERYRIRPADAYMLCSLVADLRISEIVDMPNVVVTCAWPVSRVERGVSA